MSGNDRNFRKWQNLRKLQEFQEITRISRNYKNENVMKCNEFHWILSYCITRLEIPKLETSQNILSIFESSFLEFDGQNSNSTQLKTGYQTQNISSFFNCQYIKQIEFFELFRVFSIFGGLFRALQVEFDNKYSIKTQKRLKIGWNTWPFQLKLEIFMYFVQFSNFQILIVKSTQLEKTKNNLSFNKHSSVNSNLTQNISTLSLNPKIELDSTQNFEF